MVRVSKEVMQKASKTLSDILVCPLSKHPLRFCEESNSLISDAIGVAFPVGYSNSNCVCKGYCIKPHFPIKNGIPCLVPKDGKILEEEDASKPDNGTILSAVNEENQGRSA